MTTLDPAYCADGCGRLAETERPRSDGTTEQVCGVCAHMCKDGQKDPTCSTCNRTMAQGCLPSSCPRWQTTDVYDHEARRWLPVDPDGFVLDGRRIEEIR